MKEHKHKFYTKLGWIRCRGCDYISLPEDHKKREKIDRVGKFKDWNGLFQWFEETYDPITNNRIAEFEVKGIKGTILFRICYGIKG